MQIAEDQTNQQQQPWRPPHANHNNNGSESNYGFHPSRVYPNSCHFLSSLEHASNVTPLTHPFVWDPPPPYTQMQGSCNTTTTVSSAAPPMQSQAIQTGCLIRYSRFHLLFMSVYSYLQSLPEKTCPQSTAQRQGPPSLDSCPALPHPRTSFSWMPRPQPICSRVVKRAAKTTATVYPLER